jgi:hypothetical protein
MVVPLVMCLSIVLILGFFWTLRKVRNQPSFPVQNGHIKVDLFYKVKVWCFRIFIYSLKILYFPICAKIFSTFNCVNDGYTKSSFLNDALFINCSSSSWNNMTTVAVLGIVFYVVGILAVFMALLYYFRPEKPKSE